MLYLETRFNKRSASRLEAGTHLSQHQQCAFHWVMQKDTEISVSNQQMETLCIGSTLSVPQALAQGCAVSLDKPQEAVSMRKHYFPLLKRALSCNQAHSHALREVNRGTELNMCLGSCDSFWDRSQPEQCCNLFYLLFQKHLSLQGKPKRSH